MSQTLKAFYPAPRRLVWGSGNGVVPPTVDYNFLLGSLPSGLTFSRASGANYYNASGILTAANSNVPRFSYNPSTLALNGLWSEGQSTNVCLYSTNIGNPASWYSFGTAGSLNATVAPDGTTTGSIYVPTSSAGTNFFFVGSGSGTGTTVYTQSVYMKSNGYHYAGIDLVDGGITNGCWASFDLNAGTVTGSGAYGSGQYINSGIQACPNGWYRCWVTGYINGNSLFPDFNVADMTGKNGKYYWTPNGTSGIQIWGSQLEVSPGPSSFIYTTSASATRAQDFLSETLGAWYNANAGTCQLECIPCFSLQEYGAFLSTSEASGGIGNRYNMFAYNSDVVAYDMVIGATEEYLISTTNSITRNAVNKMAFAYGSTTASVVANGVAPTSASYSGAQSTVNQLQIGWLYGVTTPADIFVRGVKYWNTALTATQLEQVTT